MAQPTTFAQNATIHNRRMIEALQECFADLDEYQDMGGGNWITEQPYGDFTKAQIDGLMGAVAGLKAYFDANSGYFYEGAQ